MKKYKRVKLGKEDRFNNEPIGTRSRDKHAKLIELIGIPVLSQCFLRRIKADAGQSPLRSIQNSLTMTLPAIVTGTASCRL